MDKEGNLAADCRTVSGKTNLFTLPGGSYTVKIKSCGCVNPGGFIKWLELCPKSHNTLNFYFTPIFSIVPAVPVTFKMFDANYPGIINMNGEISIWQKQIRQ